ncbi:hypothetical protein OAB44_01945 [Pelagibacteraceae bacterium]|nr:hypothetical protein [Pelagibacteraceae bacterium]
MNILKECAKCKKTFNAKQSDYCSPYCQKYSKNIICTMCGNNFIGRSEQKYCSKICKQKAPKPIHSQQRPRRKSYECVICKVSKEYTNYRIDSKKRGWRGLVGASRRTMCKPCELLDAKKRYRKDSSAIILAAIKTKCKLKKIKFDIDRNYLKSIMPKDMICPVMKKKMYIGEKYHKYSPTIDRIIPSTGYVKGNVIVVSRIANMIKTDANVEQIEQVYNFYKKKLNA